MKAIALDNHALFRSHLFDSHVIPKLFEGFYYFFSLQDPCVQIFSPLSSPDFSGISVIK